MGIARLFTQSVAVQTFQGAGIHGGVFAASQAVSCFVNDSRKLVRDKDGSEVVSSTTLYAPLADLAVFAVGSKVTVNGRTAVVLNAYQRDSAGPASAHHAQIELT